MTEDRAWRKDLPKSDTEEDKLLPKNLMKAASDLWDARPYQKDITNQTIFEQNPNLSGDQFQSMALENPQVFGGLHHLMTITNQLKFLQNTFRGQQPSAAGIGVDHANSLATKSLPLFYGNHLHGNFKDVHEGLVSMHKLYADVLNSPLIQDNKAFLDSPSGIHLNDMVTTILPKHIEAYKQATES